MSDEEAYPPLPPSPTRERKSSCESGGSHDSELANIPPPVGRDVLDEIPYPTVPAVGEMDVDVEIPLPADSSRYSPSHVLGAEEEEEIVSPSDRKKSVLGKAQAKKRLLAFSAAKAAAAAAAIVSPSSTTTTVNSAMKKPSPLKPVGQKQKAEPVLAIHSIKEEETQLKKMLAMNSILADKLHQVKMIATNVPGLPSISTSSNLTAVVKPLVNPSPLSESTVDSSSKEERRRSSKKSKRRHSSQSPDSSKARSPATDEKKSKKRSKKSKSRSRSKDSSRKSKKTLRRSRSHSGSGSVRKKEEKNRRSKSPSQSYATKKKTQGGSRMSPPPPPPKVKKEERSGEKVDSRHSKKEQSRDRERHRSGSSKSSRGHEESEKEREPGKRSITPIHRERSKKYDKVRQSRMPADWTEYKKFEYESSDINLLWNELRNKDRGQKSGSRSSSCSPVRSTLEQPTMLSKTLAIPAGERQTILLSNGEVGDYPAHLIKWTKEFPRISFGFNPFSSRGYYKTRNDVYKTEDPKVLEGMTEFINLGASSESQAGVTEKRDWWAVSEQVFCPSQGSKGVLISHLYSDDEESKSPFPVTKDEVLVQVIAKVTSDEGSDDEDDASVDSAPSPLLKRKYDKVNEEEPEEPPSPLLYKPLPRLTEIKEEELKPKVPMPSHKPTSDKEDPIEPKLKKKKPKKEKKMKRGLRKKELTTTSDDDEEEEDVADERHKRKKGKKKSRKRGKTSSDEDEDEKSHKGKKKKTKKEKKKKREKSPTSSDDENDGRRKPSGGGGSNITGSGFESHRDDSHRDRDQDRKREKSSRDEKREDRQYTGGGSSGGRRRNYMINPEDFIINPEDFDDVEMSEHEELSVAAQWEAEEAEALKDVRAEEAVKLESEAQMIISDLQDDHIFQMLLQDDLCSATFGDIFPFSEEPQPEEAEPREEVIEDVKQEKVKEKKEKKEKVKEKKEKVKEKKDKIREKGKENRVSEKSSRRHEYSDEEEVHSSRHHHRRHRHGYGQSHSHGKRSEERSKSRTSKTKSTKPTTSPPLQLNVADSTISDADLIEANPYQIVPPPPLTCGPGFIGGISKDILLDVSANHFNPNNFNTSHGERQSGIIDGSSQNQSKRKISGFMSPPRRLSLDERLEMEMGIKLRDEVPKAVPMPPYYAQGQQPYYQGHEAYSYPPPNHHHPQQIYQHGHGVLPWHQQQPPMTYGTLMIPQFQRPPPRPQSQIIQVGNMIQVVPAEIPTAPITITCTTTPVERQNYDIPHQQSLGQQEKGRKRVVTIKVPVVPFSVPMVEPVNGPTQAEIDEQRLRRKRRALRRKRLEQRKAAEAMESSKLTGEYKIKDGSVVEDEVSAEELALLKEAISEVPNFESETSVEEEINKDEVTTETTVVEDIDEQPITEDLEEKDEVIESNEVEEAVETVILPIPILPPPEVGILVPFGLREQKGEKKSVKFADGIHPGCGSPPVEAGEEMNSPPPPPFYPYKKSFTKENGASKKKKIKVKVMRKKKSEKVKVDENAEPPPGPKRPYPFCPIGILYQVCPQYAVLYAQTMAEKGYDIIFEPSTQQPYIGKEGHPTKWSTDPSSTVSKIPTIMSLSREERRDDILDLDEIELPRSPILDDIPLPSDNPNLLVISPTKIPIPAGTPPPPVSTLDDIPLPTDRRKRKRKHYEGEVKKGGSISIPLSRIAAAKRTIGVLGYERSKVIPLPQQQLPQQLYDFDYDFTPLSLPPSVGVQHPQMRMDLTQSPTVTGKDYGGRAELELAR